MLHFNSTADIGMDALSSHQIVSALAAHCPVFLPVFLSTIALSTRPAPANAVQI